MPLAIAGLVAIALLGAVQGISAIALRDRAVTVSWMHVVPPVVVRVVDALEPHAYVPEPLRRVLGAAALRAGDFDRARRFAASLHDGPDRDALEGAIAQSRGDERGAIAKYLAAGDLASVENRIDALVRAREVPHALELARALLDRLIAERAQNDTIAEATYRLANVQQARAYEFRERDVRRRTWELRSRDTYVVAVRLAPLEERYAIALANQSLNIGDLDAARALFVRVHDLDPGSIEPLTGLADAAIRGHDARAARGYLDAARRLAPGAPAIAQLDARIPR